MHMADALVSPVVGGVMLAVAGGTIAYTIKKMQNNDQLDEKKIPLMGVMGAFVFAAQMINFAIPGTGSSGHIGGGMLLSIIMGPYAGFLSMASILLIQALFFADGGLLAYGCNVINLGFYTCFFAYPLIYKRFNAGNVSHKSIFWGSLISAVIALQLGAFSVVIETMLSGTTKIPFGTFTLLMQPIHLAIGLVEGLVTAAVVTFVWKARPEILVDAADYCTGQFSLRKVLSILVIAVVLVGGVASWFASSNPDGLEWSMMKSIGEQELETPAGIHNTMSNIQSHTAFLPDYGFRENENIAIDTSTASKNEKNSSFVNAGTSASGLIGSAMTLMLAAFTGLIITVFNGSRKRFYRKHN